MDTERQREQEEVDHELTLHKFLALGEVELHHLGYESHVLDHWSEAGHNGLLVDCDLGDFIESSLAKMLDDLFVFLSKLNLLTHELNEVDCCSQVKRIALHLIAPFLSWLLIDPELVLFTFSRYH